MEENGIGEKPPVVKKRWPKRSSLDDQEFINLLHGSDPVRMELNRLQNQLKDKDRELAEAHNEIKALRLTERAKHKALDEVNEELRKMIEKVMASDAALESKNLEVKKLNEEKKAALAAQFAAEATLRRVHMEQKEEDLPSLETILVPLEAENKLLRQELLNLQDDNRALERLTKSKEAALVDAEREVHLAIIKSALVDELQNRNQELTKQTEICLEDYKILDKMHRLKVAEVEKLSQTIHELEEALLSGAAAANTVRDYQRQICELKGEKRTLERTLSRVRVTENRFALVIANEYKDDNDKVMPVKQWLEERRILMGEMQQFRDKLVVAERAAKAEAQLKEKFQLRLKILEDALKSSPRSGNRHDSRNTPNGLSRSLSVNGADFPSIPLSSGAASRKLSEPIGRCSSTSISSNTILRNAKGASRSFDGGRTSDEDQFRAKSFDETYSKDPLQDGASSSEDQKEVVNDKLVTSTDVISNDSVSGVFYDILQKEVVALRKACHEKEKILRDKDSSIEILSKKTDTLSKAMEVETRKLRREKAAIEKEVAFIRLEKENEQKSRRSKGFSNILRG